MAGVMMHRVPGFVALLAIAASACTWVPDQSPSRPATASAEPVAGPFGKSGYHCPPAGTVVLRETLEQTIRWSYEGTDPADPNACLMSVNGKIGSYLFGMFATNVNQVADIAAAYRKALSGPPGTVAEYRYIRYDNQSYTERVENEASETVQIGRLARPAVRIAHAEKALGGGNFVIVFRRWFDVQTGALIQQSYQQISGGRPVNAPTNEDWTATRIFVPK